MAKQDITPADSVVPVYLEPPTQAELDARQADAEALETQRQERATKLASAITKLKALGLTESEAKIIIGIE
jgi:hypothetical protein